MMDLQGDERKRYVKSMFGRIARRYDLMNRLMTFGQDIRWRREAVKKLTSKPGALILDVGAGTGDVSFEVLRQHPDAGVVACDLTPGMMAVGRQRHRAERVMWVIADTEQLPFKDDTFDGVISGFLLRNVSRLDRVLAEQLRVLSSGCRMVSLDTTPPAGFLRPFIEFHIHVVIPLLGKLIARNSEAYTYLPDSTEGFLKAEVLAEHMRSAGYAEVDFSRRMFGAVAIHWGKKG
jgi:demethylmenaquinone methyltransferase/2-methoxy-6-polyprenyl-1,4-benzoquinol methylase